MGGVKFCFQERVEYELRKSTHRSYRLVCRDWESANEKTFNELRSFIIKPSRDDAIEYFGIFLHIFLSVYIKIEKSPELSCDNSS